MFTYIDPGVRRRLIADGKLLRIDAEGRVVPVDSESEAGLRTLSVLGPIPLPLNRNGRDYQVNWYASVRHTELSQVQALADDLREHDGQRSFAINLPKTENMASNIGTLAELDITA